MNLRFLFVGGEKVSWLDLFCTEYEKKISRFFKAEIVRMRPSKDDRGQSSFKQKYEAKLFLEKFKSTDFVVVFDERGESYSSQQFSKQFERWLAGGKSRVVFCVGGAFGFDDEVRKRADKIVSLSSFIMNHHLAQAVVLEQVYRALTIQKNLPYHNEG